MIALFKVWTKTRGTCYHLGKKIEQSLLKSQATFEILNVTLIKLLNVTF